MGAAGVGAGAVDGDEEDQVGGAGEGEAGALVGRGLGNDDGPVVDATDETVVRAVMRSGAAGIITSDVTIEEARVVLSAAAAGPVEYFV